jgi:glycosyltransferase involved in cell wall biosynthesis
MKILAIIPAYNEQDAIGQVIERIRQCDLNCDLLVIDDSSSDETSKVARNNGVPVLRLAANQGVGGAVQAGFKYAVAEGYDIVVQHDGDGQHDPRYFKKVFAPILANQADCVIGSRFLRSDLDKDYKTPFSRRMGMLFSSTLLYLATGKYITDTTSGFRALNTNAFRYFAREYPTDHPEAEALLMLMRKGFRVVEVPIKMRSRKTGSSSINLIRSVMYPFRVVVGFLGVFLKK